MSANIGYATLSIIPSAKGFGAALEREVGPAMAGVEKSAGGAMGNIFSGSAITSSLTSLGGAITRTVTGAAKIAGAAAGAILGASLIGGMNRVLDTEDATKMFRQLGLDDGSIGNVMGDIDDAFRMGSFAFPDLYGQAAQALAAGVDESGVLPYMEALGDVAAFSNTPLDQMGGYFSRVASEGRLTGDVLNQMSRAGVPISFLADTLGVTVEEFRAMTSAGEITSDMFFDLIGNTEAFAGASDAMADTTRGAWANLKTAFSGAGEALLQPWFGENGTMVTFLQSLGARIYDNMDAISAWGERIYEVGMTWIQGTLMPALERFGAFITDTLLPALRDGAEWFSENREAIMKIVAAVVPAVGVIGALATSFHLLSVALRILGLTTPVGIIMALVAGIIYAYQNSETFRDIVHQLWDAIKAGAEKIAEWIAPVIEWFQNLGGEGASMSEKLSAAWQYVQDKVAPVIDWFQTHVGPVITSLAELAMAWWEKMSDAFGIFMAQVKAAWDIVGAPVMAVMEGAWEQLKNVADTLWNAIRIIIETVLGVISGVIDTVTAIIRGDWDAAWSAIKGILDTIWEGIKRTVENSINFVLTTVQNVMDTAKGVWESVWTQVSDFLSGVWDSIKETVSSSIEDVLTFFRELPDRILTALGDMRTWLIGAGKDLIQGLIDGIRDMAGRAATAAIDAVSGAVNGALSFLGIRSPSRVFMKIGQQTTEGFVLGLLDDRDGAARAMQSVVAPPRAPRLAGPGASGGVVGTSQNLHGGIEDLIAEVQTLRQEVRRQTDRQVQLTRTGAM